jgi:hypothetical protein
MTQYKDYTIHYQLNSDTFYIKAINNITFISYENTIENGLFAYKQSTIKNIFDNLLTDKNICIDFIITPKTLTMKCSYSNDIVDITFDLILNEILDEKYIMIEKIIENNKKLIEENMKLKLEKDTSNTKLKQYTSLPQLNWELELETILKTFLNPDPAYCDKNAFKNNTNYHTSLNKNFSEISNSIKNININETIYNICYYSYSFYVLGYITYSKFFLITDKNIYKLQIVSPQKNNIKIRDAPDYMIIPNNIGGYQDMSLNNIYNFIKCKSINEDVSLASIERYIKHTSGDKSSYRFQKQQYGSMNLEHDSKTMYQYLNELESSLLSLF